MDSVLLLNCTYTPSLNFWHFVVFQQNSGEKLHHYPINQLNGRAKILRSNVES